MKRASTSLFITAILLLSTSVLCGQTNKSLVKSFNMQGQTTVALQLGCPIEIRTWASDVVQVQMNIHLNNGSESTLTSIIQTGRYNMKSTITPDGLLISCPSLLHSVKYNGTTISEVITVIVFVPNNVVAKIITEQSNTTTTGTESLPSL